MSSTYGYVVIDSGAVIRNNGAVALSKLLSSGERCCTTPTVMSEIRDAKSREVLDQALSIVTGINGLEVRTPSPESIAAVCTFARKTGDYRSLSGTDVEVLALQYELDILGCGSKDHLRLNKFDKKSHEQQLQECEIVVQDDETTVGDLHGDEEEMEEDVSKDDSEQEKPAPSPTEKEQESEQKQGNNSKSWASVLGGSTKSTPGNADFNGISDEVPTSIFAKMKLKDHTVKKTSANSCLGGQFDDAEEEESNEDLGCTYNQDDILENEIEQEFPSLAAAATIPYDGSDDEESPEMKPPLNTEELLERKKQDALKPKLTKDGRQYNSFASSKYKHLLSSDGIAKNIKSVEEIEREREVKKVAFIQDLQSGHEIDEIDPEWKNKSRIMNGSDVVGQSNEVDDDGEGWVNVSNFRPGETSLGFGLSSKKGNKKIREGNKDKIVGSDGPYDICRAACATTDFAMQNVILQMGMKLITVDGMAVRRLKQWVTRCGACFTVSSNDNSNQSSHLFCARCGSDMLQRVAASVDGKTGRYILHLSKKRQKKVNLRGTKFSLPKPGKGNRFEGDLLLREDQLMMGAWHQKVKKGNKEVQSIFGSDITMGVGLDVTKRDDVQIGFGRRNPNASKFGRERRGKKKKNPTQKACGLRRNF